ncbi:hypothetical protein BH20ACT2_BH20ACT2_13670 [soil metagenome]
MVLVDLLRIQHDLESGADALGNLDLTTVDAEGGIGVVVGDAADQIRAADSRARSSPVLEALSVVPGMSGQIDALRSLTGVAAGLGEVADGAAGALQAQLDRSGGGPETRLALLDTTLAQIDVLDEHLDQLVVRADGWLLPPLADARSELVSELDDARTEIDDGHRTVAALREFLAGPGDYLVLAANNAEMRAGGGMVLSAGTIHVEGGEVEPGDFVPTSDLHLGYTNGIPVSEELDRLYGDLGIGYEWRSVTSSPNFPAVGPVFSDLSEASGLGEVDGVIMVDAIALSALLAATGPVEFEGETYTVDTVAAQILNENYKRFTARGGEEREERTDLQGRLALAIFDSLNQRDVSIPTLAGGLAKVAKGRHLVGWAKDPELQAVFGDLEADGALQPDGLMVTVQNIGGSKLDWYIQPSVGLDVQRVADGTQRVTIDVSVPNPERGETSRVIEGGTEYVEPGDHRALLGVYLPQAAYDVASPTRGFTRAGVDGPMKAAIMRYEVPYDETDVTRIEFSLPPGADRLTLLPSARVFPVEFTLDGKTYTDAENTEITWD